MSDELLHRLFSQGAVDLKIHNGEIIFMDFSAERWAWASLKFKARRGFYLE